MGSYSKTYRATAAPSVGTNWTNAANIYDGSTSTYAERYATSTSAIHINGFGINLPDYATVTSLSVTSRLYSANSDGYIYIYVLSDLKTSASNYIIYKKIIDGGSLSAQNITHTFTPEELIEGLNKQSIHNGNLIDFLKSLRVRFVAGDAGDSALYTGRCRIYDNYVVVNYTIPDITYTYVNYDGSVIDTRVAEQGSTPTHPQSATRPSTAEYDYTFSGWSLSGTTYTAQYTATKRKYLIRVLINPEEGGEPLLREYSWEYGTETHLIVVPKPGYKFAGWDDGTFGEKIDLQPSGFGFKKNIIVTEARDYIAYFEPVYITYDSIFNYLDWKNKDVTVTNGVASNITDTGLTLTTNADKTSSRTVSPFFPVEYGKSYKIDIDIEGPNWTVYIFFCDADENRIDFVDATHKFSSSGAGVPSRIFTAPDNPSVIQAQIRLDCRGGGGGTATYHNFRIFPAEYEYMSTTVDENERVNYGSWNMPTPIRNGYKFIEWNTKPDGSGETYTNQSHLPTEDLTLYSQWELDKINKVYIGNQLVSEIYVGTKSVQEVYIGTTKVYG